METWRSKNQHNYTNPKTRFDIECVEVGKYTYGDLKVLQYNTNGLLKIGHFCSIAPEVTFVLNADHDVNNISTYPFKTRVLKTMGQEAVSKGDIIIDDDVWIGYKATILSGVHIGQGAVVGAGAVVTKDVPPYSVVGGVPAKVLRYRFAEEVIEELCKIDYSKLDINMIRNHENELYEKLNDISQLEWLPKK